MSLSHIKKYIFGYRYTFKSVLYSCHRNVWTVFNSCPFEIISGVAAQHNTQFNCCNIPSFLQILWLAVKYALLAIELSVVIFGIGFSHLDSESSIKLILFITCTIALGYSVLQVNTYRHMRWGGGGALHHRFIYIALSSGHFLLNLNLPFKLVPRRFKVVFTCHFLGGGGLVVNILITMSEVKMLHFSKDW